MVRARHFHYQRAILSKDCLSVSPFWEDIVGNNIYPNCVPRQRYIDADASVREPNYFG